MTLADARSDALCCENRCAVEPCFFRSMPTIVKNATDAPIRMMKNVAIFDEPGIFILAIPFDRQSSHPCDMRDSNTPRIHLVFGFQTALQILRSLDRETVDKRRYSRIVSHDADATSVHRTSSALPRGVPSKPDLSRAFDRLCLEHPGLEFDMPAHLLIGSGSRCRSSDRAVAHLCKSAIPRRALCRLDDSVVLASPNLALCQMASRIHDSIALLQLLWEACGTYGTPLTGPVSFAETAYELRPLTSLRAFCSRNSHLNGAAKIARMLKYMAGGSASPRETGLALLLGLPGRYGGYNLGIPIMNHEVKASRKAWEMSGKRSFRLDLCWPEARIDVEYERPRAREVIRPDDQAALQSDDFATERSARRPINQPTGQPVSQAFGVQCQVFRRMRQARLENAAFRKKSGIRLTVSACFCL